MKITEMTAVTLIDEAEQILIPDRYTETFSESLAEITGLEIPDMGGDRKTTASSQGKIWRKMRGRDIPRYLPQLAMCAESPRTVGVSGTESCEEAALEADELEPLTRREINWLRLSETRLGRLALITPPDCSPDFCEASLRSYRGLGVVTAVPRIVGMLGALDRCNVYPAISVNGGVESWAEALNMPAIDLVVTGETVGVNGFQIIEDLVNIYPAIVTTIPRRGQTDEDLL